jgi:hypothetical protein
MREKCDLTSFKKRDKNGWNTGTLKQPEHPVSATHRQFFLHSLTMSI